MKQFQERVTVKIISKVIRLFLVKPKNLIIKVNVTEREASKTMFKTICDTNGTRKQS